jgi:putative endonuclease
MGVGKYLCFWRRQPEQPAHLATGEWGETIAARALVHAGYKVLGRRVRVGVRDELDVVARDGNILVFVEVKTRREETFGRPASAVDRAKRHTLSRAAVRYLKKLGRPVNFRFDVMEVIGIPGDIAPEIRHICNAFSLDRCYRLPF